MLILHHAEGDYERLLGLIGPYTRGYAARHGYEYSAVRGPVRGRHPYWAKFALLIDALRVHEEVLYMDVDTVIALPEEPMDLITGQSGLGMCWHSGERVAFDHWNVGVMHVRSCALALLQAAWDRYPQKGSTPEETALNEVIAETKADVACLDHAYNESAWLGTIPTRVRAWHAQGDVDHRLASMKAYMIENRLWSRV